jgi:hypothetical protein
MPLFAIIAHDVADSSELRKATRPAHIARLKQLEAESRLVIAGPTPIAHAETAMSGSIVIAAFNSLTAAQEWANADPYFAAGVYSHVDIKPFIQALPQVEAP